MLKVKYSKNKIISHLVGSVLAILLLGSFWFLESEKPIMVQVSIPIVLITLLWGIYSSTKKLLDNSDIFTLDDDSFTWNNIQSTQHTRQGSIAWSDIDTFELVDQVIRQSRYFMPSVKAYFFVITPKNPEIVQKYNKKYPKKLLIRLWDPDKQIGIAISQLNVKTQEILDYANKKLSQKT